MKDTQGNNLAANEVGKLNEMTTTTTETAAVSKEATVESVAAGKMTKEEIEQIKEHGRRTCQCRTR